MFSKLKNKLSEIAASINGRPADAPQQQSSQPKHNQPSQADEQQSILDNAIDNRDQAVRLIVNELKPAAGTNSSALANLIVWVEVESESYDPMKYPWADEKMRDDLRHALDNALLTGVGAKSITIRFAVADTIRRSNPRTIVENQLYVSWRAVDIPKPQHKAWLYVEEGTGSLREPVYTLDSSVRECYHIGRGAIAKNGGTFRKNDIIINESDPDESILRNNLCVSSMQADIISRKGSFWLKACPGGCRACGGTSTKIYHGETVRELHDVNTLFPLADGDMIELGKSVMIHFTLSNPQ